MASKEETKQDDVVSMELPAPAGWVKKFTPRKSGTPHKNDIIFISPTGEEMKSKRQLEQYLKSHAGGPPASEFDWGTGDTPRRSARLSDKSKAVEAPESQSPSKKQKKTSTKKEPKEKYNADAEGGPTNDKGADTEGKATTDVDADAEGEAIINKDTEEEGKSTIEKDAEVEGEATADMDADSAEKATNDKDAAAQEVTKENLEASILVAQDDGGEKVITEGTLPQKSNAENVEEKTELETEHLAVKTPNEATTEIANAKSLDPNVVESEDVVDEGNLKEKKPEEKAVENEPVMQEPTSGS